MGAKPEGWKDGVSIRREDGYFYTRVSGRMGWSPDLAVAVVCKDEAIAQQVLDSLPDGFHLISYEMVPTRLHYGTTVAR